VNAAQAVVEGAVMIEGQSPAPAPAPAPAAIPTLTELDRWAAARGMELGLHDLVLGPNASGQVCRLADRYARGRGDVVVLTDDVTYDGPAGPVKEWLVDQLIDGGRAVRRVIAATTGSVTVHADEATLERVESAASGAAVLVSIGSGTLVDIGKVIAARLDCGHVAVQSAASVNGFSDDQSVLLLAGAKRTVPSRWPDALVVDLDLLARAPASLNRAGLGDLLSMFTGPADWLLADTVGLGPSYRADLVDLVRRHGARLLRTGRELGPDHPDNLRFLAELLTLSGLTMGLARSTAPSSGTEHVISHLLEMVASTNGRPAARHGEQVGIATVVAAAIWARIRELAPARLPELRLPDPEAARELVLDRFRPLGESTALECWRGYARKLSALHEHPESLARLRDHWPRMQESLDELLVGPTELVGALRAAGAQVRFGDLAPRYDPDTVHWAVANGHRMRDRFLVTDLADLMGIWTDDFVAAILADLSALGAVS
jgi:glycerol-1-phosphate dehydrogenase [NAD(P)+]